MDLVARLAVGVILLASAAAKVRAWRDLADLFAAYGVPMRLRRPGGAALIFIEGGLGALLLMGVAPRTTALAATALGGIFALAVLRARLRGARRLRCGCFGTSERSTAFLLVRAVAFTALAALAAFGEELATVSPSYDTVVVAALAVLALAVAVLSVLVLALYRQVGVLTLRIGPRAALELAEEGPEVGAPAPPLPGLRRRGPVLVVFFAPECRLCRELAPAVRALERDGLAVETVYESDDPQAFVRWNVPGAPFVVHVVDGTVAAKGLVNTLEQLEDLVARGGARTAHAAA